MAGQIFPVTKQKIGLERLVQGMRVGLRCKCRYVDAESVGKSKRLRGEAPREGVQ